MRKTIITTIILYCCSFIYAQNLENTLNSKPFDWNGSIGTSMTYRPLSGSNNLSDPFYYSVFGSLNLKLFEVIDLPFAFQYTQMGVSTESPYIQTGISPRYKWAQLHLGHRSMHLNSYTLSGHTFLGAGLELNPGKFRFASMYGRLRDPILLDARTGQQAFIPQFQRKGWGVKMGVGTHRNHVDLMLFRASDQKESIENWQDSIYQSSISGQTGRFAPAENIVLGLSSRFTIAQRIIFNMEAGSSIYTRDVTSDMLVDEIKLFTPKLTSTFSWAAKSSLSFPLGPLNITGAYERIMPEYYSMGTNFLMNDQENITFSPSGTFFRNRLSVNAMIGNQRNNLLGNRSETTRRIISNLNAVIAPKPHYGMNVNYSNFSFNQQAEAIILEDSILIKQVNQSLSLMPYYNIVNDTLSSHQIQMALIMQKLDDLNPVTREFGNMQSRMISSNYSYNLNSGYSYSAGLNHTRIESAMLNNTMTGLNLGFARNLHKKGINLGINSSINSSRIESTTDGFIFNLGSNIQLTLKERHNLRFNMFYIHFNSKQFANYDDIMLQLGYTYRIR